MHEEMRRSDRALSHEVTESILECAEYGMLATVCEDGSPYAVAVNYIYDSGRIYFHCARDGQKLKNIRRDGRVCFTVATDTHVVPEKFTTLYKSAVAFGTAKEVDGNEKVIALYALADKYASAFIEDGKRYIAESGSRTSVVRIDVAHMSGKAST